MNLLLWLSVRFSPLRCGGPRPICWFMPNGSWGFGFVALVCRAESELVLSGRKRRKKKLCEAQQDFGERKKLPVGMKVSESSSFQLHLHTGCLHVRAHAHTGLSEKAQS